ncbi:hypothetical protein K438DRAFT_908040 [Mycena galopus ATCC 62051]|nr:hypothetical protein K438DRAFT_908040 [Mycena galopus ATCC 62051]
MQRPAGQQLPSIRTLHPYLPPPAAVNPGPPTSTSNYMQQTQSHAGGGDRYPASSYAGSEGDGDERDAAGDNEPPKKKRRRQALSCTECKRRKIRCDRTQPCGPCVKRGDQPKCQWHVVEPAAEKYIPRSEYDTLRGRVDTLEERISSFEGYIRRLPREVLALHPLPPGLIASQPPEAAPSQGFNPRQSPPYHHNSGSGSGPAFAEVPFPSHAGGSGGARSFSGGIAPWQTQPRVHPHAASASLSPTQRHATFSPTGTISIPPGTQQRQRGGSQYGHSEGAAPPQNTVAPSDIHPEDRRDMRGRRSASFSATQTQGGQWGEGLGLRSFPVPQTFSPAASASGSGTSGHGRGTPPGQGRSTDGGAIPGPQDASRTLSTASGSPSFAHSSTFSSPHVRTRTLASPFSTSPALGSLSSIARASGGAGSGASRTSPSSISTFASSSGSASGPGSVSSFSSATPTTYASVQPTRYTPPPFQEDRGQYQHMHVYPGDGDGVVPVPAHPLAQIVRPDIGVGVAAGNPNVKRPREDVTSKNRPAQAPQGARLRAGPSAPCIQLRLLPRRARPPLRRHTPRPTAPIREPEVPRVTPATRRAATAYSWTMAMRSPPATRRLCRLVVRSPRSARHPLRNPRALAPGRTHPRSRSTSDPAKESRTRG